MNTLTIMWSNITVQVVDTSNRDKDDSRQKAILMLKELIYFQKHLHGGITIIGESENNAEK